MLYGGLFLQTDCAPLCYKVNFLFFVHFPNLQITSSRSLITYYWKNKPLFASSLNILCLILMALISLPRLASQSSSR